MMTEQIKYLAELNDRKIDYYGNVIIGTELLEEIISEGLDISQCNVEEDSNIKNFNRILKQFGFDDLVETYSKPNIDINAFHQERSETWFIPDKYISIDIKKYVLSKCKNADEIQRVEEEWKLYEERNLIPLLRWLYYIIEIFRENNVVKGVGRGSSVSSFVLYLLGVHKINSLTWGLDVREFLK